MTQTTKARNETKRGQSWAIEQEILSIGDARQTRMRGSRECGRNRPPRTSARNSRGSMPSMSKIRKRRGAWSRPSSSGSRSRHRTRSPYKRVYREQRTQLRDLELRAVTPWHVVEVPSAGRQRRDPKHSACRTSLPERTRRRCPTPSARTPEQVAARLSGGVDPTRSMEGAHLENWATRQVRKAFGS